MDVVASSLASTEATEPAHPHLGIHHEPSLNTKAGFVVQTTGDEDRFDPLLGKSLAKGARRRWLPAFGVRSARGQEGFGEHK